MPNDRSNQMKLKSRITSLHVSAWYLTRQSGIEKSTGAATKSIKLKIPVSSSSPQPIIRSTDVPVMMLKDRRDDIPEDKIEWVRLHQNREVYL